jgi:hypothetical protein
LYSGVRHFLTLMIISLRLEKCLLVVSDTYGHQTNTENIKILMATLAKIL